MLFFEMVKSIILLGYSILDCILAQPIVACVSSQPLLFLICYRSNFFLFFIFKYVVRFQLVNLHLHMKVVIPTYPNVYSHALCGGGRLYYYSLLCFSVSLIIPVNGRKDLANDLRDTLDRRYLSPRRHSPTRDGRGHQAIHEHSPSRSMEKKSDRRHWRKQGITGQSDISASLKVSDRIQEPVKEGKFVSSCSRNTLEEQLKKVQLDIRTFEDRKFQLSASLYVLSLLSKHLKWFY
ncbi:hypothetical protein Ahy_B03g067091 isoform H [Arachis hypogaea]|uniref:Uncharacterized protein n=1 Tax=Arachis hypogaea TaxID=3818 RepID=A0A445A5P2_ARAHY|nr:hypothetical protein Ahy_B03g067091 isoform H [Arachis hypogaea]